MDQRVLKFLKKEKISVLTTLLKNGQPHSATVHCAFSEKPLYFVIWTGANSRKLSNIKPNKTSMGSMVIGFSEKDWLTMQMEGTVKWVKGNELNKAWQVYRKKHGGPKTFEESPDSALVTFTPKWWRFTKVKPFPSLIISSEKQKNATKR